MLHKTQNCGKILLTVALIIVVGATGFAYGALTIQAQVFPYTLLVDTFRANKALRPPPQSQRPTHVSKEDILWAERVIQGGYILVFRHAHREDWHDVRAFDAYELASASQGQEPHFARATCLSEQGMEEAKLIGKVFDLLEVNVSYVISSPSCRARQTAEFAFGSIDRIANSLLHRTAIHPAQHDIFDSQLRDILLSLMPSPPANIVLSGHSSTLPYHGTKVLDQDSTTRGIYGRRATGFIVLENQQGKLVAQHTFPSIRYFVNAALEVPFDSDAKL